MSVDLTPYRAQINAARADQSTRICQDPRSDFTSFLQARGFKLLAPLVIGKFDRMQSPEDKPHKKSASYIYHEIDDTQNDGAVIGIGFYEDHKTKDIGTWTSRSEAKMTAKELSNYRDAREIMRKQQEDELKERHNEAAERAACILGVAKQADNSHPYLLAKKVKADESLKIGEDGRLIIPMFIDGSISSLQFVDDKRTEEGWAKRFLFGGKIKGAYFVIEGTTEVIYVAEGYSTGKSVNEATGATVYVAFNAGNLYEVSAYVKTKYKDARIIIAGDDDFKNKINSGRLKAEQAAYGLGLEAVFPTNCVDFNDMHQDYGIESIKKLLIPVKPKVYENKEDGNVQDIERPTGILGEIYDYYNATSGNVQYGFAIQSALALCAAVLGRKYRTDLGNWPNLYFVNVGKSATGKEYGKRLIENCLHAAGQEEIVGGDGYTSAGAVFSTLLRKPNHYTCIDEFGLHLEAAKSVCNSNRKEANTKLMEAIGRTSGVMRPPNYSTMTMKKADAKAIEDRLIWNPSITILGITTPSTLAAALDMGAVKDGFINRFIYSISDAKRSPRKYVQDIGVPDSIIKWIGSVCDRNSSCPIATEKAMPIILSFTAAALNKTHGFELECIDLQNKLELQGMEELAGRSNEMAMKMSLVVALSRDPYADEIEEEDVLWSIRYVRSCLMRTIEFLNLSLSSTEFEGQKKEILQDIRNRGKEGITWSMMQKTPPYSKYKSRDLKEMLNGLKDAELIFDEPYSKGKGRPTVLWTPSD